MKIAQIGNRFEDIQQIEFFSTQTFLEFDALIVSISTIAASSPQRSSQVLEKRKADLVEFLSFKKIPIIYLAPQTNIITAHRGNGFITMAIDSFLPTSNFELAEEAGTDFQILPKTPLTKFFQKYKGWFRYSHYYKNFVGTSIASTYFTNKTLAFYDQDYVFLPPIISVDKSKEKEFLYDLLECVKTIKFDSDLNPLPKWVESYFLPEEFETKQKVISLKSQIEVLKSEIDKANIEIARISEKKRLITATGNELEIYAEKIFRELGFEILEANKNRDDLIVKYEGKIAVVEIKGLTNSAGEKNAAQLEKWRSEYFETHGIEPKGILLINTFRDTPLAERNQPDFPDQMLRYSNNREHCLITTIQFLILYFEVLKNPELKGKMIESLFSTVGKYESKGHWHDFIMKPET
jgi:hypothetical protein